ncbi:MAG: RIP metalloprotease RseP [Bdellovibrionales bacterium]|nr:RIP metalloprotease RseP [Bdellovibrionales bacterium]
MLSILGFVVVLIPLVVVHELGHFLFAKLFNVRAEAFSIGFGPVLFNRKLGETDFRLSAIPLGGYVKLLGEDPSSPLSDEDKKRALHHQAPWKRFFIFFGGPLFNFLWAIIVFMAMMAIGEPQIATVVGRVLPDTPAATAKFVPGDKIIAIDGETVTKYEDVLHLLTDKPAQEVTVKVERANAPQPVDLKVMTSSEEGFSQYGEKKSVGNIDGIVANPRMTKIAIADPQSIAAKAGFKTGDEIVSFGKQPVANFEQLERLYANYDSKLHNAQFPSGTAIDVEVVDEDGKSARTITLPAQKILSGDLGRDYGLFSSELFVDQTMKDSPAEKAGIKKGDQLLSVNGNLVRSFFELRQSIQKAGEDQEKITNGKVNITVVREGKTVTYEIIPQVSTERDPLLKKTKQYTIGVMPIPSMMDATMIKEQILNPFTLLYKGTARMLDLSARNLISIGKMIQGHVSVKSLGGPILIGKLAGDSLSRGLIDFLKMMAILSIGLGILNILPIPVLDGGHIVLLLIESVRGKSLSLKQIEIAQQVGLVLILGIMAIVMKNDISRLPIFN